MAAEQRKLLEQLMGDQLMGPSASRSTQLSLTDPKVCRSFIAGTCPHDLFTNTKQDLGTCSKVHSENLKIEYDALSKEEKGRMGFEYDYWRDMQRYIDDCNRRIDAAQRRLEKTPDEIRMTNDLLKQISTHHQSITSTLLEISTLGSLSLVSRALSEYHTALQPLKQQKDSLERDLKALSDTSGPSGHQKLQVCDVCGAYLSRLDNDRRLADHFYGKMHLGYAQMRREAEKLRETMKGRAPPVRDEGRGQDAPHDAGYGVYGGRGGGFGRGGGGRGGGGGYGGGGRGGGFRGRGGGGGGGGYGGRW
ncbi:MAG: splicing factor [Caeruleum heppii]|nr:MAG: splicing factor [Caeruleum heppii]